jgi:hypothetical protein
MIEAARPDLGVEEIRELEGLVAEYEDIFTTNSDYRRTDRVYHRVDTAEAWLIHQPPRRLPLAKQAEVDKMLEDMQQRRVIEESESPWFSSVILIQKKNGDLCFCVDYRK